MTKRSFFVKEEELDDFQRVVLNKKIGSNLIIQGCAGSGKSVLALWKVKQIQTENKGSYIFIVFTETLKRYMNDGISSIGINVNNVMTSTTWIRKGCPKADFIIVDEAQDFSLEEIDNFRNHATKALMLYGDTAQQLYKNMPDRNPASMHEIINYTEFKSETLTFNHRLPKTVAKIAEYVSQDDDLEIRCTYDGSSKPKILQYNNIDEELNEINRIISSKNLEDVGILFLKNEDVEYAFNYLQRNSDLNIEARFKSKTTTYKDRNMTLNFNSNNPKIITYHSSKGLQFQNVFLPECSCYMESHRNPLYVAMTRTYENLYIMHSGNLSSFLQNIPSELYDTSLNSGMVRF